jgi:hypothetical protein
MMGGAAVMVSSYLICDACGRFGPPAGFLSENGLRLCYQCWYQERQNAPPDVVGEPSTAPGGETGPADRADTGPEPG